MAAVDPEHLLDQAIQLLANNGQKPPRQTDIRRAVSAAYYALFHTTCAALADEVVGRSRRKTAAYGLAYRSVAHRSLRSLCLRVTERATPKDLVPFAPTGHFSDDLRTFAIAARDLQGRRELADYDPLVRMTRRDAIADVAKASRAIEQFRRVQPDERKAFLLLLVLQLRSG